MHDVLVPARDSRTWQAHVEYAARLAVLLDGTLTAVYNAALPMPVPDAASPGLAAEIIDICREEIDAALHAHAPFERWARGLGVRSAAWHVATGPDLSVLQSAAKWNDVIVLERSEGPAEATPGALGQTVLNVGLPCIIVPGSIAAPALDVIAVAWKGTVESTRALHAALPLLKRAKRIVLIYGERGVAPAESETSVREAQQHLQQHGLSAALKFIDPESHDAGQQILTAAAEASAGLLVMGCFGRTRLSEWMFGGATRHVLQYTTIPVFMRH